MRFTVFLTMSAWLQSNPAARYDRAHKVVTRPGVPPLEMDLLSSHARCDDYALPSPVLLTPRALRPLLVFDPISSPRRVDLIPSECNYTLYLPVRCAADQRDNISDILKRTLVLLSLNQCCVALLYGSKCTDAILLCNC
ncbi:unnamed protein product, partial [Dicrocoelium dendriticum]